MPLTSLTISRKLAVIAACFLLPLLTLLYFVWQGIEGQIAFARAERAGLAYHVPLNRILKGLLELQNGQGSPTPVEQAWKAAEEADRAYGQLLSFTQEGLVSRGRGGADLAALRAKYDEWRSTRSAGKLQEVVTGVRTMITHLGDTSNLILDPDLDSYYLMDIQLLALPQTQERLARIRDLMAKPDAIELAVMARLLKESDLDRIRADGETTLKEDGNFQGKSPSLQAALPEAIRQYAAQTEPLIRLLDESGRSGKLTRPAAEAGRLADAAFGQAFALWDVAARELDRLLEQRIAALGQRRGLALGASAVALIIALVVVWRIAGSITGPLRECCETLEAFAAKDLSRHLEAPGNTELARIAQAINRAMGNCAEAMGQIRRQAERLDEMSARQLDSARDLASQAGEVSEQTRRMGAIAACTKSNFSSVATASEEMVTAIREISRQTQEATRVSGSAVQSADAMQAAAARLTESAAVISGIITVINGIAEQTNLLALNATIEAARVGEAGKGFAVVADEVKTLARRTAEATEDVRAKVAGIGSDTRAVVEATGSIRGVIEEVSAIQTSIAAAVEEQTVTSNEIGRNIGEATMATTEMAEDVERLAPVMARTSEGARSSQRASEQLAEMAGALIGVASEFRL